MQHYKQFEAGIGWIKCTIYIVLLVIVTSFTGCASIGSNTPTGEHIKVVANNKEESKIIEKDESKEETKTTKDNKAKAYVFTEPTNDEVILIKSAVIKILNDPDSARFGEIAILNNQCGCISVNAKNGFGGYTGTQQSLVIKNGNAWRALYVNDETQLTCLKFIDFMGMVKFDK
jgi:hypothetical protein